MIRKSLVFITLVLILIVLSWAYLNYQVSSLSILNQIRFPRLMLVLLTGFILGGVGYCFQLMLNNPLAEPYILGISSGAAFGSILAGVMGLYLLIPVFGFAGAIVTMILVWNLAHLGGFFNKTRLLLAGIIIGMFFSAMISLLMYFNQQDIGNIINVLMGNLGHIFSYTEWKIFIPLCSISFILLIYLFFLVTQLQILTTGDLLAGSMGIEIKKLRFRLFILCSLLTGITVSYAGIIGFIGLMVPHIIRMIMRKNSRLTYVYSMFAGGILLLICDFIAAHIAIVEIPVGIITAFLGCPFFIFLMAKAK